MYIKDERTEGTNEMTTKTRTTLTVADIEAGYEHESHADCEGWLGFGYLGERRNALDTSDPEAIVDPERVKAADLVAVITANRKGWSPERFFDWLNSKDGRWFGEAMIYATDPTEETVEIAASYIR